MTLSYAAQNMEILKLPLFERLENSERILLAGAGGGFDIFCGLPIYFALSDAGKKVHLANLSFSALSKIKAEKLSEGLFKVDADTVHSNDYFPEAFLSSWFRKAENAEVPIYCFEQSGVKPLATAYRTLARELGLDTIILIDGGTDSLMRGDEVSLGTPMEDIASIAAVSETDIPKKFLACLGAGVDSFHGVCHSYFFEAISDIAKRGGYLGALSLTKEMPEVVKYRDASEAVLKQMPSQASIVNTSILDAINGNFGNHHSTDKTAGGELWINPLMPIYWFFNLPQVAERILYLDWVVGTETFQELGITIENFRKQCRPVRPWRNIPI
jgi:hypothetical protein